MKSIRERVTPVVRDLLHDDVPVHVAVEIFRDAYLRNAVAMCDGSVTRAAQKLGVHRNTVTSRLPVGTR